MSSETHELVANLTDKHTYQSISFQFPEFLRKIWYSWSAFSHGEINLIEATKVEHFMCVMVHKLD